MKNTLFISIFFIVSICNAQKIKVTVNEAQLFVKYGIHTNQAVLDTPDEDQGLKQIDCDYVFDLQENTSKFYSRSLGGIGNTLPIVNVTKKGSLYILETNDYSIDSPELSLPTKIYVDVDNKTMLFTWYDPYLNCSLVSHCGKLKLTVEGMQ